MEEIMDYVRKINKDVLDLNNGEYSSKIALRKNLSGGINEFPPPALYTNHFINEIKSNKFVGNYTLNGGYPMLIGAIKYYEKSLGVDDKYNSTTYADNVCITAGATAAINFFFEYLALKYPKSNVLFLGLNYYVYYRCTKRYNLHHDILISKLKDRVAPTIEEIKEKIEGGNVKIVVLTLPLNPSGEIYTENELKSLISLLKQKDILLLIDKCQLDEFASVFEFVNINKIVIEEDYIDNVIIINSISKTRSLPGARLGYIIANEDIITYIKYLNEIYYFNAPTVYIIPFVIDLISRSIFIKSKANEKKIIMKMYKYSVINSLSKEVYEKVAKPILDIACSAINDDSINYFYSEIDNNYKIVYSNYQYTKIRLKKYLYSITSLEGGINFCIKINNTKGKDQIKFCKHIIKNTNICILPEYFYNNNEIINNDEPFWIRITAAQPQDSFCELIDIFAEQLESLGF